MQGNERCKEESKEKKLRKRAQKGIALGKFGFVASTT